MRNSLNRLADSSRHLRTSGESTTAPFIDSRFRCSIPSISWQLNLVWATACNIVAIPVAAGLLVRWGVDLSMSVGAVAMSLLTVIVSVNAQLLRRLNAAGAAIDS